LKMKKSIIDMQREVVNMLKRIGKAESCLDTEEMEMLQQLRAFLKPFRTFTDLVGTTGPNLSLIPLIKLQVKKLCVCADDDVIPIRIVKDRILAKVESRLPDSHALRVLQLLDPNTKDGVPRHDALSDVTENLSKKGIIAIKLSTSDDANNTRCDSLSSKRRKLKAELVNELRQQNPSSTNDTNDVTLEIKNYLSSR